MRKNILFRISSYILAAAVFVGGGVWIGATFAGNASTGVLPESAGGTGATTLKSTLTAAVNGAASSILYSDLTASRLLTSDTNGKVSVLGAGTSGQVLKSNGTNPVWSNDLATTTATSSVIYATANCTLQSASIQRYGKVRVLTAKFYSGSSGNPSFQMNSTTDNPATEIFGYIHPVYYNTNVANNNSHWNIGTTGAGIVTFDTGTMYQQYFWVIATYLVA